MHNKRNLGFLKFLKLFKTWFELINGSRKGKTMTTVIDMILGKMLALKARASMRNQ